jgi:hypothetical protein
LRRTAIAGGFVALTLGCSALPQRSAQKPPGTRYSAAFIDGGRLHVFPFDRDEIAIDLPAAFVGNTFSTDGTRIYGFARSTDEETPPVAVATIKPSTLSAIMASRGLSDVKSVTADADGGILIVSAVYQHNRAQECGLFELDIAKGTLEHVVDNPRGECFDFVSSWNQLSLSPDGKRAIGTAGSGTLGVINLRERKVEKLWPGSAAWWSPDGRWIAALNYGVPADIELIRASDLSTRRTLGRDTGGRLQWSPDSRHLLLLAQGLCGLGSGYLGTLQMLDIETGRRTAINSSRCKVNHMSTGWVSDDMLN